MRTKKNRKNIGQCTAMGRIWDVGRPTLERVKFDTSLNLISCFMSSKAPLNKIGKKKNHSFSTQRKSSSKGKSNEADKVLNVQARESQISKPKKAAEIFIECTNSIVEKIEEKGINCAWQDAEEEPQILDDDLTIWSAFDNNSAHEKSFASTNDFPHYYTVESDRNASSYSTSWSPILEVQTEREYIPSMNSFEVQVEFIQKDWRTTLMIRNIPNKYTIHDLAAEIDAHLPNTYDFLYLPCDFKNQCNVGYGFINFVQTSYLEDFYKKFNQHHWKKYRSEKICALTYARLQGLNQLIEHFQNSKVLNQKDKKYRPIIKYDKIHKMVLEQQGR